MIVGSDRVGEFRNMVEPYFKKGAWDFNKLNIISAGDRDADSSDIISAMSASRVRNAVISGNYKEFLKGINAKAISKHESVLLYNTLRKYYQLNPMDLTESKLFSILKRLWG